MADPRGYWGNHPPDTHEELMEIYRQQLKDEELEREQIRQDAIEVARLKEIKRSLKRKRLVMKPAIVRITQGRPLTHQQKAKGQAPRSVSPEARRLANVPNYTRYRKEQDDFLASIDKLLVRITPNGLHSLHIDVTAPFVPMKLHYYMMPGYDTSAEQRVLQIINDKVQKHIATLKDLYVDLPPQYHEDVTYTWESRKDWTRVQYGEMELPPLEVTTVLIKNKLTLMLEYQRRVRDYKIRYGVFWLNN
jgi:hypothetical protein